MSGRSFFAFVGPLESFPAPRHAIPSTRAKYVGCQEGRLPEASYMPPAEMRWHWLLMRMKGYTIPEISLRWGAPEHHVFREVKRLLEGPNYRRRIEAHRRFQQARQGARARGIGWEFTFDQWWKVWMDSGRWDQRGTRGHQYVMARTGDVGPYASWNVRICPALENILEAQVTRATKQAAKKARLHLESPCPQ